jgi:hypothetical protein
LSFFEGFVTFHLDRGVVNKDVLTRITLNKPVPFVAFEPLYGSLFSHVFLLCLDTADLEFSSKKFMAYSASALIGGLHPGQQRQGIS